MFIEDKVSCLSIKLPPNIKLYNHLWYGKEKTHNISQKVHEFSYLFKCEAPFISTTYQLTLVNKLLTTVFQLENSTTASFFMVLTIKVYSTNLHNLGGYLKNISIRDRALIIFPRVFFTINHNKWIETKKYFYIFSAVK